MARNQSSSVYWYDQRASQLVEQYEQLDFEQVHGWLLDWLPNQAGALVLDVGAGSGRDAAWLASQGHDVVAVEPAAELRKQAQQLHPHEQIRWLDDSMPDLSAVHRLGTAFDVILLSAVWMHIPPDDRARCFRKLVTLLKPGGVLAITLRLGEPDRERGMYAVSVDELHRLAREHGSYVEHSGHSEDALGRAEVSWAEVVIRLPNDGTGSLPLLRHVILNDKKSSTYKLALLRTLCRIADSADGLAVIEDEDKIKLPLGLVALTWIRLFMPMIRASVPQMPKHQGGTKGLDFAKKGFCHLITEEVAAMDLRVGMRFEGERAVAISKAVREAAQTITNMPAYYITYPNGGQVFVPTLSRRRVPEKGSLAIDAPFLWTFGELEIPEPLWRSFQRFSVWVEPALITEWKRLSIEYAQSQGRHLSPAQIETAFVWSEPQRDVAIARQRFSELQEQGFNLRCVWTDKRLRPDNLHIDHCFPWSAWPCDDLWNLLPSHKEANIKKGSRLPSAYTLERAKERIQQWWDAAYQQDDGLPIRFRREAAASLPGIDECDNANLDDIYSAVSLRRVRLKHDQQIPEWVR